MILNFGTSDWSADSTAGRPICSGELQDDGVTITDCQCHCRADEVLQTLPTATGANMCEDWGSYRCVPDKSSVSGTLVFLGLVVVGGLVFFGRK